MWKSSVSTNGRTVTAGFILGIRIAVVQRTLTPLVGVRLSYPQPYAPLTQLVEYNTFNVGVVGSSPTRSTIIAKTNLKTKKRG